MAERFTEIWTPAQDEAEADRLVAEGGDKLLAWLSTEGLVLEDAGNSAYGAANSAWVNAGLKAEFKLWHAKAKRDVVSLGVTGRSRVASRLVTRFSEARLAKSREHLRPVVQDATLDGLSPELAWVARHPEVHSGHDGRRGCCTTCQRPFVDPVVLAMRLAYEKENRAPNELALTMLRRAKDEPKVLDGWLKDHLRPKKAGGEAPDKGERPAAEQRIADLKAELASIGVDAE